HFTIKAVLPEDAMQGVLKVYAGKRGLMHSNKDIPYPLAFALPIVHGGENLSYDFVLRHPTPHAQSRDLYIVQPQCSKLAINNTFVFTVRQHPSSLLTASPRASHEEASRTASPGLARPASSLSMVSSLAHHSNSSTSSYSQQPFSASASNVTSNMGGLNNRKPAKLAIQSPAGKILRLTRKAENLSATGSADPNQDAEGSVWETVIKVGERGTWRALVLADRSNRWCVWAEWECI
ncbi:cytokinesis protein 3, partial [Ascosphaera atra]